MSEPLLTATEAAARLGMSRRTFYNHRHSYQLRNCVAPNTLGQRKYIASQIDAINEGRSTGRFGRRSA